jgi:diaminohydroxyphosphoribosylaminopyrimidine deaminase/5-amino-6-(5-phosphoribosylamino)uracil reductase
MRRALRLAARGYGRTNPNPMVGAVVVKSGEIVGEGYHIYAKQDHAEVIALRRAGRRARGADLYVTLEPCSHFGRTPPCVERIESAGIRRVLVAVEDPNPLVQGKGIRHLKDRGIQVEVGLCREEAARLNAAFFHFIVHRRPYVTLKLAMTLDGKIATRTGDSQWITGSRARHLVHRLRYGADAILVGIGTVRRDDPSLDVRWRRKNRITKVILDTGLQCPPGARLFESGDSVILFHRADLPESLGSALVGRAELIPASRGETGLDWREVLDELGRRNVVDLLVEGGARIATSLLASRMANRIDLFYGPMFVGADGLSGVGNLGTTHLTDSLRLADVRVRRLGEDIFVTGVLGESS